MEQSGEDLQELKRYLDNIKSFEKDYLYSERSTIAIIWGIFLTMAGLIDGYIASFSAINYSPHGPVWFLTIAGGLAAQQIISSQPLLYDKEFTDDLERDKVPLWEVIVITLVMVFSIVVAEYNIAFVIPYIALTVGSLNLIVHIKNHNGIYWRKSVQFLPFFASFAITVGLYFYDTSTMKFFGLILGLIVGISVFLQGFNARRSLQVE